MRTIYTVLYYSTAHAGPAGDGSHVAIFRREVDAAAFARDALAPYGTARAVVEADEVPAALFARWEREGKVWS